MRAEELLVHQHDPKWNRDPDWLGELKRIAGLVNGAGKSIKPRLSLAVKLQSAIEHAPEPMGDEELKSLAGGSNQSVTNVP